MFVDWFLIFIGAASAVILGAVLWIGKRNFGTKPGRPDGTDVALGAGIVASQHHGYTPVDGGSAGSAGAGGDGGGASP